MPRAYLFAFLLYFFLRPVFRNKQAAHRQNGTECYQQGDFFLQDNSRSNDGDDGNHININAGLYCAQLSNCQIPGDEAEGGSAQSQKDNVEKIGSIGEARQVQFKIQKTERWHHKENAVEKGSACSEDNRIAVAADFFRKQGIKRPYNSGGNRQQITQGIELHGCAVEADAGDADHHNEKADDELFA